MIGGALYHLKSQVLSPLKNLAFICDLQIMQTTSASKLGLGPLSNGPKKNDKVVEANTSRKNAHLRSNY